MRTTLSLDDDVAAQLEQLRARGDRSFRQLVNEALRVGLAHLDRANATLRGPFTRTVSLGAPRLPDVDDVSEALVITEGEGYR
ncbi:MAG: ribbon-helix-helix protein, CopG family [Pseudonocardiales bacterium]|nr:ribbon-helix-helix protein, CopG family [Pseudonocardiales bacterium]MBV9730126.1 ribbon-helix-helix protein, CopG family [Pseudonocardiales bacterium]